MEKILRTEHLFKTYGKRTVVNDVSIDVKQGEIVGLLGPNGAGKTTTFYMTTGLVVPNSGKIFLNEQEITKYPVYKRAQAGIGYLAQEASVFRKMTVEDNIKAVLEMTKFSKEYQRESAARMQVLQDSIMNYIVEYNVTRKYDAILYKAAGVLFNPALDITKEIIVGLNKRYSKPVEIEALLPDEGLVPQKMEDNTISPFSSTKVYVFY